MAVRFAVRAPIPHKSLQDRGRLPQPHAAPIFFRGAAISRAPPPTPTAPLAVAAVVVAAAERPPRARRLVARGGVVQLR